MGAPKRHTRDWTWGRPLEPGDPRHGYSGYTNYGCKCDVCMAAQREQKRRQRNAGKPPKEHGTVAAYENYACRCDACRAAKAAHMVERRERLKGTEPRKHGTNIAYNIHACRCEKCKGWARKKWAVERARRQTVG